MFGMKFYDQGSQEELDENSNTIFIINDENNVTTDELLSNNDLELKKECFNKWKNSDSEKCDEKNIHCNQRNCDFFNNDCNQCKKSYNNEEEKLNEDDCDEDVSDKLYIISMDGIPYYYENDLVSARSKMWTIANNLLRKDSIVNDFENQKRKHTSIMHCRSDRHCVAKILLDDVTITAFLRPMIRVL